MKALAVYLNATVLYPKRFSPYSGTQQSLYLREQNLLYPGILSPLSLRQHTDLFYKLEKKGKLLNSLT